MTKEEFIKKYDALEKKANYYNNKELDEHIKIRNLCEEYGKENQKYATGTILKLRVKQGKVNRYKIVKVDGNYISNRNDVKLLFRELQQYDKKKLEPESGDRWYTEYRITEYEDYEVIRVLNEDDIKTCSCDTCQWLEAYRNTIGTEDGPLLHCGILIDKKVYEEGRPACERYSWWTWSPYCGGKTHRQQLMDDNGEMSHGEKEAQKVFRSILDDMSNNNNKENG